MDHDVEQQRRSALENLTRDELDVLVIGGGIVGSGIARDAAMRGLRTGLLEQHDFASGTSSRSSRLLHGGLRYLAQGHVKLVREASVEKMIVHHIAPHLAAPLPFVFPTYRAMPWEPWWLMKLAVGVKLYDILCGRTNLGRSGWMLPPAVRCAVPGIRAGRLTGAVRYFDGFTNDARLVIDTLRSAARAGAEVMNYCRVQTVEQVNGVWHGEVVDALNGRSTEVAAKCFINATGVWAGQFAPSSVKLRPTKGVHLVVDRSRLGISEAVVMTDGPRILFAIPWGECAILGTTDTDYAGAPEAVAVEEQDISYVLRITNETWPEARLTEGDVLGSWAGLRPLVSDKHGNPSDISRSHEIRMPRPGWFDVSGGKLTTYRLMAEQTIDGIGRYLGRTLPACATATQPLLPATETDGISALVPPEPSQALVEHFCANEWAIHLEDVMLRRGGWAYCRRDASQLAEEVGGWMAGLPSVEGAWVQGEP